MALKIIETADGSTSFFNVELNETYHSKHGAIQESMHVFIGAGLLPLLNSTTPLNILEIGFGTGLNAWLTGIKAIENNQMINYTALEAFPITGSQVKELNYMKWARSNVEKKMFLAIHEVPWEAYHSINDRFMIKKNKLKFGDYHGDEKFNLIYFDAFGPDIQPELWSEQIFKTMYDVLGLGGVLVTYSCKGSVRRAMQNAGFKVEKIPGPPGKREMSRAYKSE